MKNSAFIKLPTEDDSAYIDIFEQYGVSFIKGSYYKLLCNGKAKEYVTNTSRLEHGTRYLAKAEYSKLAENTVSLEVLFEANTERDFVDNLEAFIDKLSNGMFYLKIPSKYRVFKLVYKDIQPKQEYRNKKATFTLSLTEPNPKDRITL